jgi:hypothetical protein
MSMVIHCRRSLIAAAVVAAAAFALLAAGCGGGGSPNAESGTSSSTTVSTTTTQNGALAFARCLRSNGLPNWPDPTGSGAFDKSKLRQTGYSVSQVRAVEDGPCKHLLPASPAAPTITAADRADYLEAAACMRSHGFPNFPDPTFQNGVQTNVPSSINQDSPPFKSAATICTKLIPAGLPYSRSTVHGR